MPLRRSYSGNKAVESGEESRNLWDVFAWHVVDHGVHVCFHGRTLVIDRDSSVERGENVEDTRKNSRSRREEREDDIPKERKRKSKSKHGKKSDRKKSKRRHRDGEERGRRRLKKIDEDVTSPTQKSGDENSSSDDDSVDQEVRRGGEKGE